MSAVTEACTPHALLVPPHRGVLSGARAPRGRGEPHRDHQPRAAADRPGQSQPRAARLPGADRRRGAPPRGRGHQQLGWRMGERELLNRLERLWSPAASRRAVMPRRSACSRRERRLVRPELRVELERRRAGGVHSWRPIRRCLRGAARLLEDPELGASRRRRAVADHRGASALARLAGAGAGLGAKRIERAELSSGASSSRRPAARRCRSSPDAARDLAAELARARSTTGATCAVAEAARAQAAMPAACTGFGASGRLRAALLNAAPLRSRRPAARAAVLRCLRRRCWSRPRSPSAARSIMSSGGSGWTTRGAAALGLAVRLRARGAAVRAKRLARTRPSPATRRCSNGPSWTSSPACAAHAGAVHQSRPAAGHLPGAARAARCAAHHLLGAGHRRKLAHAAARGVPARLERGAVRAPTRSGRASTWSAMR